MEDDLVHPVVPTSSSLAAHLQALDLLQARLSNITTRTRWATQVPLNGKASIPGWIKHTNTLQVCVGEGWWIEMTAEEAREYIKRRRTALLEDHLRIIEGRPRHEVQPEPEQVAESSRMAQKRGLRVPKHDFNPIFAMPFQPSPPIAEGNTAGSTEAATSVPAERPDGVIVGLQAPALDSGGSTQIDSPAKSAVPAPAVASKGNTQDGLMELINAFVDKQMDLARQTDGGTGVLRDPTKTEDGLPIHEIREDAEGNTIGPVPEPSIAVDGMPETTDDGDKEYWSAEAVARREALRRKVFEDSDDDEDLFVGEEAPESSAIPNIVEVLPDVAVTAVNAEIARIMAEPELSPEEPTPRRSSSSSAAPKSILKPPSRKKSVSFDESVPLPPDSPEPRKVGFPLPGVEVGAPEPVPIIPEPKPGAKKESGFAGFKRGFLSGGNRPAVAGSTPVASVQQTGDSKPAEDSSNPTARPVGKKPSVFAQRLANQMVTERALPPAPTSVPAVAAAGSATTPSLPRMADQKPMVSMRSDIVERESPQVHELHTSADEDEEESDSDFYHDDDDDDDDDAYDLDDALLAREVALDFHRKQAYSTLRQRAQEENGEDEEGPVFLGIPQISATDGKPMIVNPAPDDVRRFIKVGKLENGNLILAPGEEWEDGSDPEEEGIAEDEREKRERRRHVKRQLAGDISESTPWTAAPSSKPSAVAEAERASVTPPVVLPAAPALAQEVKPKRVSRFKQQMQS